MTRPERIATVKAEFAELERGVESFREALRQTNDSAHIAFFGGLLDRIAMALDNERAGATGNLAEALRTAKDNLRRHRLPDLDPDLETRTHSLFALRGERGNLVVAIENTLEALGGVGLTPRPDADGEAEIPRAMLPAGAIRALDDRLRVTEEALATLVEKAKAADAARPNNVTNQYGLINLTIRELKLDIAGARFETRAGKGGADKPSIDVGALVRALEAIRDTSRELKGLLEELRRWVAPAVAEAGAMVARGAERAWRGVRTVVHFLRQTTDRGGPPASEAIGRPEPGPPPRSAGEADVEVSQLGVIVLASAAAVFTPPRTHLARWREPIPGLPEAAWPEMITLNPDPPHNTFLMGAPKEEEGSEANERPQRLVTVAPFALGRCAVTFAQWDAANAAGAGLVVLEDAPWGRGQHPVFQVTWSDAQAYCAWLNQRLGIAGAYRLPSEAEWEFACRAGTTTPFSFGKTIRTEQANYRGNATYGSGPKGEVRWGTVPVGSLPPNAWGLHEMHGNVLEWVEDGFDAYPSLPTDASPLAVSGIGMRGLRGGAWGDGPQYIRSARRTGRSPGGGREGIRIARNLC